jgi:carbon-monoxide dehydrogenase medium subunit
VYPAPFEYFAPESVEEALKLLSQYGDDAKVLAGGQSLVPMMKLRIASPRFLIDVNRIKTMTGLTQSGDRQTVGALCRHVDVLESQLIRERLPIMTDAARQTADVQVRNRGTVGGSLAHADPAGDWPVVFLNLDGDVTIAGLDGSRTVAMKDFIADAYTTQLEPGEILTGASVPLPKPPCGGAYVKFEKRAGDFAVASIAVQVEIDKEERCRKVAVTLGALGATAKRSHGAEEVLQGKKPTPDLIAEAERLVQADAEPFDDTRGSVEYKKALAATLFRRGFNLAMDRARGRQVETLHL